LAQLAGQIAQLLAGHMAVVYRVMNLPPLAPPGWLFRPAWLILYTLMGLAAYRIWDSKESGRRAGIRLYAAQLFLSALWPAIFFRLGSLWLALAALLILLCLVCLTFRRFSAADRLAGRLLLPYLIWVVYMTYLAVGFLVLR